MALAVVEHWFMVLPLPVELLWSWGMRSRMGSQIPDASRRIEQVPLHQNPQTGSRLTARQHLEDRIRQALFDRNNRAEVTQVRREPHRAPAANWRGR
jgi:hypothetical protein